MSCGIIFLSENLVDAANVSITTGTENGQFPLVNLKNHSTAVRFRSLENDIVILIDLQQTREIDSVAIHGDTNGTLGLTAASIKTSLTTDFSSSSVDVIPLSAENLLGYKFITPVSHRYVELTLSGSGSYAEISNIFVGERINLLYQNLSIGSFNYGQTDKSGVVENAYGQKFIDKRNKLKTISGNIEFATIDEHEVLDDMFTRHGVSEPLWMIVDENGAAMSDGANRLTVYGYLSSRPKWSASGGRTYNTKVSITQAG